MIEKFDRVICVTSGDGFEEGCMYVAVGYNNGVHIIRENKEGDPISKVYCNGGIGYGEINNWDESGKPSFVYAENYKRYMQNVENTTRPQSCAVQHPREPYSTERAQEMRQAGTTQGRKGCAAIRINMAFPPDLHDYIRIMARFCGQSITEFTNNVFRRHMDNNMEVYREIKKYQRTYKQKGGRR